MFAIAILPLQAAVAPGENILVNGNFDAEQVDFPGFWVPTPAKNVAYLRAGGPEGKRPAVALRNDGAPVTVSVRQQGMTLAAGETYKLSGFIRTKNFKSRKAGLIVHNNGWVSEAGINDIPADSDWTFMEKTFTLFPSSDKTYGVALYAAGLSGEVHFAAVKLEAMSEGARSGSESQLAFTSAPRLVPFRPLLNRIPRTAPELVVKFFGALPEKQDAYECLASVAGGRIPAQTLPLGQGGIVIPLTGLPVGDHALDIVVRHRETRAAVVNASYPVSIVDIPTVDRSGIRQLNNLVAEVLDRTLKGGTPQSFTFANPRDGWVFISCSAPATLTLDDHDVITNAGDRLEAFRLLPMGMHRVAANAQGDARLVVRSVPEILDYPPCAESQVKENGSYGWEFMKRHILYAVTTLNGGVPPGDALPDAKARGLRWLANFVVAPFNDPADIQARMEKCDGMTKPVYDGFTSDELFFGNISHDSYTRALWRTANPERLIYTWIVGKPGIPALHTDLMSAALNASKSRGRLLFEAYCQPQADERTAAAYLDDMLDETMRRFNAFFPDAAEGTGIIFGNFNQLPIISLEHNPEVDYKYYLDMQVNRIAVSTNFAGLACTGYWGTYYGDEEMVRWSFMLMRHYAVEGRRDMLSSRYGFTYKPGHLVNGDFANGFEGWTPSPAAEGSIRTNSIFGYGKACQGRWGAAAAGDTVCVMTRNADKPNRISQTAKGLVIGKTYCLQFVTADLKDVLEKKYAPRRYGIDAELAGAELVTGRSYVHIDQRKKTPNDGKINLHHIVFRATSPTQEIVLSDGKAAPGETLVLNFVQLRPYLDGGAATAPAAVTSPPPTRPSLVKNGDLEAGKAEGWNPSGPEVTIVKDAGGQYVQFSGDAAKTQTLRRPGITATAKKNYRMSCRVKYDGFSGKGGVILINRGWTESGGVTIDQATPATADWKKIEKTFTAPASSDGTYEVVVYVMKGAAGKIAVDDITLEEMQ